jgi:coenzyme F420-dependent glucose-6-phosphate dehydrogenase
MAKHKSTNSAARVRLGYALSSEEQGPRELVALARRAEQCGFEFAMISDHYHPWIDRQGNAPFVWAVIGAIAQVTERLRLGTGVTCPIHRIHPAILAQAAATAASLMPGRFFLGVGTGENLNEHVVGGEWPSPAVRVEMLEEAIRILRLLWESGMHSFRGRYFTVENAKIYNLPDERVPVMIAASAAEAADLAGDLGDGLISTAPEPDIVERFHRARGDGHRPVYGQLTVCWAETEDDAKRIAHEAWPNAGIPGDLKWELPLPEHFEQATKLVTADNLAERVVCGPDPERHLEKIREFADAGFDHVAIHQVGAEQEGFFRFYSESILPALAADAR